MKKMIAGSLLLLVALSVCAQTTIINDANAEKRNVSGFTAIKVSGGIDLFLNQGDEEAVAVSASEDKYRNRIKTEVSDGLLRIWFDGDGINWGWVSNKKLRAYVSVKTLKKLEASGASDVIVSGTLKGGDMEMHFSGASDFKGALDASTLKIRISGASDMTVSGTAGTLEIGASGASDFKGYNFSVDNCDATASGASDIKITVNKEMNANATGASDIRMKGNGVIRKTSNNGASSVKKI
jgi:Putative auto-transporter adhesin, head GIN domain